MITAASVAILLALQASSASPALQHLHAGVEADQAGQVDQAVAEFQKAAELDPKLAAAFVDLGGVADRKARVRSRRSAAEARRRAKSEP